MEIVGTRFGTITFDEARTITFAGGLVGFSGENRFILLEPPTGRRVAWLQSVTTAGLAFPVIASDAFGPEFGLPDARTLGRRAQLLKAEDDGFAVLIVVAYHPKTGRIANLLAPIVVNLDTRAAAQLVLDSDTYAADTPFPEERSAPVVAAATAGQQVVAGH